MDGSGLSQERDEDTRPAQSPGDIGTGTPSDGEANAVEDKELTVPEILPEGGITSLLGRQWLSELGIPIPMLHKVSESKNSDVYINNTKGLKQLLDRYQELFTPGLGRVRGGAARLQVREGAVPVFCRARPVPYALRERVEAELDAMLRDAVIEPVDAANWATPLVPVRGVLSQKWACERDGVNGGFRECERPVVYVSRALTSAEKHYSQIEQTDRKTLFRDHRLSMAASRLQSPLEPGTDTDDIARHRISFSPNREISPAIRNDETADQFQDCMEGEVDAALAPLPRSTLPVSSEPRPVRQCRINNPPRYKV
ncbi:unnamed protein product [Arctia plantaginis]|uniref:Reverse transcriptase/retrotransposon-derived protein RNase H-like domain-containing protein n=1 Tax=Arctia plantaginis TaxID=874455 RepID=A0A8S1B3V4_ARCPL|nr:unnamed protein product [Arctia plantaginis]